MIPPSLIFNIVLAILVPLPFHINFKLTFVFLQKTKKLRCLHPRWVSASFFSLCSRLQQSTAVPAPFVLDPRWVRVHTQVTGGGWVRFGAGGKHGVERIKVSFKHFGSVVPGVLWASVFLPSGHISLQVWLKSQPCRAPQAAGWRMLPPPLLRLAGTPPPPSSACELTVIAYTWPPLWPSQAFSGAGQVSKAWDLQGWVRYANPEASGQTLETNTACNDTHWEMPGWKPNTANLITLFKVSNLPPVV